MFTTYASGFAAGVVPRIHAVCGGPRGGAVGLVG
jgi:hypothetical protein